MEALGLSGWFLHGAVLAPGESPSGTQQHMQKEVRWGWMATHRQTAPSTQPLRSDSHSANITNESTARNVGTSGACEVDERAPRCSLATTAVTTSHRRRCLWESPRTAQPPAPPRELAHDIRTRRLSASPSSTALPRRPPPPACTSATRPRPSRTTQTGRARRRPCARPAPACHPTRRRPSPGPTAR